MYISIILNIFYVVCTVSSHDQRDQAFKYEQRISYESRDFSLLSPKSKYIILGIPKLLSTISNLV